MGSRERRELRNCCLVAKSPWNCHTDRKKYMRAGRGTGFAPRLPRLKHRHLGRRNWSDHRRPSFSGGIEAIVSRGEVGSDREVNLDCLASKSGTYGTGDYGRHQFGSPHRSAVGAALQQRRLGGTPGSFRARAKAASFAGGRSPLPPANRSGASTERRDLLVARCRLSAFPRNAIRQADVVVGGVLVVTSLGLRVACSAAET